MGQNFASPYYGSAQPVSFLDDMGSFFGNLGNSWQGGEDQAMYGGNPQGLPYATVTGAYNAGQATAEGATEVYHAVADPVFGFAQGALQGVLRGAGVLVGVGIIAVALMNARDGR